VVEIGRLPIVELIDQRDEGLLLRGRPPQLQQHVRHRQIVRHSAAVVRGIGLGTGIARQRHQIGLNNLPGNHRLRRRPRRLLRMG